MNGVYPYGRSRFHGVTDRYKMVSLFKAKQGKASKYKYQVFTYECSVPVGMSFLLAYLFINAVLCVVAGLPVYVHTPVHQLVPTAMPCFTTSYFN